jgi:hypothetical protein
MFRARRSGTLADAFGRRMLGECWVGAPHSAGMIRLPSTFGAARRAASGTETEAHRTVSQAGGNSYISAATCERRYSRKYGSAKST